MKYLKRAGHFVLDVITWFFPTTSHALDPHSGPDEQVIKGSLFSLGLLSIVPLFALPYIPHVDLPWWVVPLPTLVIYVGIGLLYASYERRNPSAWDKSWLISTIKYHMWRRQMIQLERKTGVRPRNVYY